VDFVTAQNFSDMIQAKKTWYNENGDKVITPMTVANAEQAYTMAQRVFHAKPEAYVVSLDYLDNGGFVTRVASKEKMLFKIEHHTS